jgi:hypothetical protein
MTSCISKIILAVILCGSRTSSTCLCENRLGKYSIDWAYICDDRDKKYAQNFGVSCFVNTWFLRVSA